MTLLYILSYAGIVAACVGLLWFIDALFLGVANRLHNPGEEHPHRVATELPRVPHE